MKKVLFLTGTRADYGKLKSLMRKVEDSTEFELNIFVTGMHMLEKFGFTFNEIEKDNFSNIYPYINQSKNTSMDIALSNTILGLSNYINENRPDLIVIHGDRLEALAGAIVGAFNNIKVAHIEGGEVSGTIDESIRHAITKFSHFHFVANEEAKNRVLQLGESEQSIFVIGSPDIDIMYSEDLPSLEEVRQRYEIKMDSYAILMYHPVTTESKEVLKENIENLVEAVRDSKQSYIVIYPNNDSGSDIILSHYKKMDNGPYIKMFPSIRFEYFLTLLKNAEFILGNSSAGVREASVYGVPSVNIGTRQQGRVDEQNRLILNTDNTYESIIQTIEQARKLRHEPVSLFGSGNSDELFMKALKNSEIWDTEFQKRFIDLSNRMDNYV